jgi:hypothetical protein
MSVFLFCCSAKEEPQKMFSLPKPLKEVSGITLSNNSFWAIADSGNKNLIFQVTDDGTIEKEIQIANATNIDWEDLTCDTAGNLFIGDFGNNDNARKDLCIYAISKDSLDKSETKAVAKINFSYPEQKDFPPVKTEMKFDAEAFIVYQNHFYIFTKNRSKNFDGTTLLYRVPMTAGTHQATLIGSFVTDRKYNSGVITGAAISPDQQRIAILSHQKVWVFEAFKDDDFFSGKITEIALNHHSQKEAITFKDNATIWIADEKVKKSGGNVYQFELKY